MVAAGLPLVELPTIDAGATHATIRPGGRPITAEHDAFHATIEDRYPPIWGLRHNETPKPKRPYSSTSTRSPGSLAWLTKLK